MLTATKRQGTRLLSKPETTLGSPKILVLDYIGYHYWDTGMLSFFSAFGKTSIPSNNPNLVKEVIGSSFNGETYVTWLNIKNKLSLGESICSDHEENKKICADALLGIWVYVRKLER